MQKTLLFMDNHQGFLLARSELLEQEGYRVLRADSIEQAEEYLRQERIHLAVLDVRAEDDDDVDDISGLLLAKKEEYRLVPKILLTAYPNWETTREALGAAFDGLPLAINYIFKREGSEALIRAVEQAFSQHVNINWDLRIEWKRSSSFAQIVSSIDPEAGETNWEQRSRELEDLLCRIFHDYTSITIEALTGGNDNGVLVWVQPEKPSLIEPKQLLKFTSIHRADWEETVYKKYANLVQEWGLTTTWERSINFAAIVYTAKGFDLDSALWMQEFFKLNSSKAIEASLDDWYMKNGRTLYSQSCQPSSDSSLNDVLREAILRDVSEESFRTCVQDVMDYINSNQLAKVELNEETQRLAFTFKDQSNFSCPNPALYIFHNYKAVGPPVLRHLCLQNIGSHNVLIDKENRAWLMDITSVSPAPVSSDFVSLEARLRFEWFRLDDLGWDHLYKMEKYLSMPMNLNDLLIIQDVGSKELKKMLEVISRLRQLGSLVTGAAMFNYNMGILFQAASIIAGASPLSSKARALLGGAVISYRLEIEKMSSFY